MHSGTRINIKYFIDDVIDPDDQADIFEYFRSSDTGNLEDAYKELGDDFSEEEIRLVRIKFLSDMGN